MISAFSLADKQAGTRFSGVLALVTLLSSCTTLDQNQCLRADWYAVGLEDGAQGRAIEYLGNHRRACAEYGVTPQTERYIAGRDEGLKSFCTYERGLAAGRGGQSYAPVCPANLAGGFSAGYERGKAIHDLRRRLDLVQEQIRKSKAAITAGIPNPKARAAEAERIEDLSRESEHLEGRIAELERR